jgi:hypothetical protein
MQLISTPFWLFEPIFNLALYLPHELYGKMMTRHVTEDMNWQITVLPIDTIILDLGSHHGDCEQYTSCRFYCHVGHKESNMSEKHTASIFRMEE